MSQRSDYTIRLEKIHALGPELNKGLLFLLVISGKITVEMHDRFYHLEEQDLLVVNRNELYRMEGTDGNRVLTVSVSDEYMKEHYDPYYTTRFECFSGEVDRGRREYVKKLRRLLADMLLAYYKKDESYKIELQSYLSSILLILIRRFRQKTDARKLPDTDDQRLQAILTYLEEHYHQPVTLESTARKFYLSAGYLSRYFKQKTGTGFNRYLMEIRLKHAVRDLLYTTDTIAEIAMKNGFPNAKSFSRYFKEMYEMTPNQYRETHHLPADKNKTVEETDDPFQTDDAGDVLKKLYRFYDEDVVPQSSDQIEHRFEELTIDAAENTGQTIKHAKHNLMIGELGEILKSVVRTQLLMAKRDLGLSFVGVRRLIHGSVISPPVETDEEIPSTSPYFNADFALNFLYEHGLSLFVSVDYQEISEDEDHFFSALEGFLRHSLNLYGMDYVTSWYFMFHESYETAVSQGEMERVYLKLYHTVKRLAPDLQVGLFLPFSYKDHHTGRNHRWILEKDVPADFFGFEVNQNEVIDFEELGDERFVLAADYIEEKTEKFKACLRKYRKEKPLHLISWNTLTGRTRLINGTFFRGALIFKHAFHLTSEFASIGFWINTEQHEKTAKNRDISLKGIELFHYFSGKRPAYFATQFLNRLNGEIISMGKEYIMTKNHRGYQLVLMNYTSINPYYSIEDVYLRKLNKDVRVTIKNLAPGHYQIRKLVFDKNNGALYTKWRELNSKYGMDEEVIRYITETSQPSLELFDMEFKNQWSFYSFLTFNAVHFYEFRRVF